MTTSRYPEITDELLSAYIDGAVTSAERMAVEQAVQDDPDVAWRLSTLQETVHLLRSLPAVQAPRSFVLTAEQVGKVVPEPALSGGVALERTSAARAAPSPAAQAPGFWERVIDGWRRFWQGGSPALRNAMAASMAALLLLLIVPTLLSPSAYRADNQAQPAPANAVLTLQSNTLSAKEAQSRDAVLRESGAPAQEAAAVASDAEAPAAEEVAVSAAPQTAVDRAATDEGGPATPTAALAAPGMAAAASAAESAAVLEDQPAMAAAAALPEAVSGEDALAFAPSAAVAAQAGGAASALVAAAPAGADQAPVPEPAAAAEVVSPAATALPEATAGLESAANAESQPATEEVAAAPAAQMLAASPSALPQPESPAAAVVMAPVATQMRPPASDLARISAQPRPGSAMQSASIPATQNQMWLWAQLVAAAAVLVFGLLWWRSRRTA